jgi:CspA family cold shock protein
MRASRPYVRIRFGSVPRPDGRIHATVEWWSDEEGWGALAPTDETPGGIFVHFSAIKMEGYKSLRAGQKVDAEVEGPLRFKQDGYRYRAMAVWPLT